MPAETTSETTTPISVPATAPDLMAHLHALLAQAQGDTEAAEKTVEKAAEKTVEKAAPNEIRAWLKSLEDRVNAREVDEKKAKEADEKAGIQKQITKLVQDGDVDKLKQALGQFESFFTAKLGEKDQKLSATEQRLHETLRRVEVGSLTAGVKWAGAAAGRDALAKIEGRLEVALGADGNPIVREKGTGRPAEAVIKEALASDDFAHFLDPGSRGKGGVGGGHSASPTALPGQGGNDVVGLVKAGIAAQKAQWKGLGQLNTGDHW